MNQYLLSLDGHQAKTAGSCLLSVATLVIAAIVLTPEFGLIGMAFGLGFIFGPALGGVMAANFGHAAPMHTAGVLAMINAVLIFFLLPESLSKEQRERLPKEKLSPASSATLALRTTSPASRLTSC